MAAINSNGMQALVAITVLTIIARQFTPTDCIKLPLFEGGCVYSYKRLVASQEIK
jgi:hypothetical protein